MKFKEIRGDLFSCPKTTSLAHCISADCRMGKGIAAIFKTKFGGVSELVKQGKKTGSVAVLKRGDRSVYYLITKDKYWQKPTYKSLTDSLKEMKTQCLENSVENVAMPHIGCGLDGLQWVRVSDIIQDIFKDTAINITIYSI